MAVLIFLILPSRIRGIAGGITGTFAHILVSVLTQTYLFVQEAITVTNVFFLYAGISFVCCIYLYFSLPETENKSLQEIEEYFRNQDKKRGKTANVSVNWIPKSRMVVLQIRLQMCRLMYGCDSNVGKFHFTNLHPDRSKMLANLCSGSERNQFLVQQRRNLVAVRFVLNFIAINFALSFGVVKFVLSCSNNQVRILPQ